MSRSGGAVSDGGDDGRGRRRRHGEGTLLHGGSFLSGADAAFALGRSGRSETKGSPTRESDDGDETRVPQPVTARCPGEKEKDVEKPLGIESSTDETSHVRGRVSYTVQKRDGDVAAVRYRYQTQYEDANSTTAPRSTAQQERDRRWEGQGRARHHATGRQPVGLERSVLASARSCPESLFFFEIQLPGRL